MNDELAALQQAIQVLHQLMTVLDDPNDTRVVAQCLSALTGIQKNMMTQQQNPMAGAVAQTLQQGGGGAGGGQGGY